MKYMKFLLASSFLFVFTLGMSGCSNSSAPEQKSIQTPKTEEVGLTIKQGYTSDSPQWESFVSDIELKTGEDVESFALPQSPLDKDVVYVSTSAEMVGEWPDTKSTNRIYSYNTKTGDVIKLYEEKEPQLLRTMGIEGTKLILMYDGIDNSPGPCFSVWADWEIFGYLDIENPRTLEMYTVPNYQVQKAKAEQKKCEEGMDL